MFMKNESKLADAAKAVPREDVKQICDRIIALANDLKTAALNEFDLPLKAQEGDLALLQLVARDMENAKAWANRVQA
jgi:hypothetical protein